MARKKKHTLYFLVTDEVAVHDAQLSKTYFDALKKRKDRFTVLRYTKTGDDNPIELNILVKFDQFAEAELHRLPAHILEFLAFRDYALSTGYSESDIKTQFNTHAREEFANLLRVCRHADEWQRSEASRIVRIEDYLGYKRVD